MFKRSIIVAAAMAIGSICATQAGAGSPTKFVKFEKVCASGTTCSINVPLPTGTRGRTYSLPSISCSWNGAQITRADVVIALNSNQAQQFVIPTLLTDAEIAAKVYISSPLSYRAYEIQYAYGVAVNLHADAFAQTTVTCYGAY